MRPPGVLASLLSASLTPKVVNRGTLIVSALPHNGLEPRVLTLPSAMFFLSRACFCAALAALVIPSIALAQRPSKPSNLRVYLTGNSSDANKQPVGGPAVLLMGGGPEVDAAFTSQAYPVANGGDVVVLRTSDSNGYNDYLYNLPVAASLKPNSVETMVVDTVNKANSAYVKWVVETAELIWIAGGDQSAYLTYWKDTALETAIRSAYTRGAVIGGTSAGCAVMSEFIYDPYNVTAVISSEAIANPYRSSVKINSGFIDAPLMWDVITDTHFYERDRMGRLMAFMARLRTDGRTSVITGIGVDESTSLFVNKDGVGTALGSGYVYVLREDAQTVRTQVTSGQPLIYRDVLRTRLAPNQTFNLGTGATTGGTLRLSVDGRYPNDPYTPSNPY